MMASRATRILGIAGAGTLAIALSAAALGSGGSLGFIEADVNGTGGVTGLDNPDSTAVSPDGKNVYVASCGSASVAVFSRNGTTGALKFLEAKKSVPPVRCPADVAVSPDGKDVYVPGTDSGSVAVFSRNAKSGRLTFVEAETGGSPAIPQGVAVSSDGKSVYLSEYGFSSTGGVVTYARNAATGALTFVEKDEAPGLSGAQFLAVSRDGKSVYVPAYQGNSLYDFARNASTGALTLIEVEKNGVGGVSGLRGASAAAVSKDDDNVYVAALQDGSVATFARNASTGTLQFRGMKKTGGGACDLSVAPDDANVYVASCEFQAIATFSRNLDTGALGFVGLVKHGDPAVEMRQAWGPSISPDGKNVYVADLTGDAVDTFATHAPPFRLTLTAKAHQSADKLKATAQCSLGCNLSGSAHVKVGKAKYDSHTVKETLPGLTPTEIKLQFSPGTLRAIRSQLKRHSGTATIRMNALAVGGKKTEEATVHLRR